MARTATVIGAASAAVFYAAAIRPWQLNWGATAHEASRPLLGDDLVPHPTLRATRAVTVLATPEDIWPWLLQVGTGRAGWYSYDLIDNFGRPSARTIVPRLQHLDVGDIVPLTPAGRTGFTVERLLPPRTMVWSTRYDTTWTWQLEPQRDGSTRILSRVRFRLHPSAVSVAIGLAMEFGDGIMVRKMLLNIRSRAET
ncbi:hypothetical protein GCM10007304_43950 [Rhodococcoides trifolii]|uniref:SRPBCC family protein n=1 Tax=Rhodococcoides trifolii TaxID=908250 RepID=A0A917LI24_9NOCA|nr:hypothetical protein [Rhodococcus trifolii]GGG25312.1 hypothetical protein GCM10007304_43950 [Rhodococcus trifolii]